MFFYVLDHVSLSKLFFIQCKYFFPASEVLKEAIAKGTDLGKKAKEMLYKGEAVPDDMMLQLLEDKIKSPEVAHYGWQTV